MFLNHVIFHLNSIAQFPSIVGATLLALARVGYWEEFLLERPCSRRDACVALVRVACSHPGRRKRPYAIGDV